MNHLFSHNLFLPAFFLRSWNVCQTANFLLPISKFYSCCQPSFTFLQSQSQICFSHWHVRSWIYQSLLLCNFKQNYTYLTNNSQCFLLLRQIMTTVCAQLINQTEFAYRYILISVCLSVCMTQFVHIYLNLFIPIYPSIYVYSNLSIYLSISICSYLSIYLSR